MPRPFPSLQAKARGPLLQVLKTSVAAIAAWLSCNLVLGQPAPIFATIAALLVVQPSVNQSLIKGVERSVGVIFGVLLAFVAGALFGSATWVVLAVILVSLLLAWALRLTPGSANQIPISAMLVVALGGQTASHAGERFIETIIGAAIGLTVNVLIVPPVLLEPARAAIARLASGIASTLDELAESLTTAQSPARREQILLTARGLRTAQDDATNAVTAAQDSLMLNPLGGRHRADLERDRTFLTSLTILVTRVLGMTRALNDHYDNELSTDPVVASIAAECGRAAHDVRLLARQLHRPDDRTGAQPITAELPALTAPLVIARPHPEHWILVGSLMEDLRRVREELIGQAD